MWELHLESHREHTWRVTGNMGTHLEGPREGLKIAPSDKVGIGPSLGSLIPKIPASVIPGLWDSGIPG